MATDQKKLIEIRVRTNDRQLKALNKQMLVLNRTARGAGSAINLFKKIYFSIFALQGLKRIIDVSDSFQLLEARLKNIAGISNTNNFMTQIKEASEESAVSVQAFAGTFSRLKFAVTDFGVGAKEAVDLTKTLANAFRVTGASTEEAANATRQFTQALFSNRLGGDEFRSVSENAPLLLKAISKELGVGTERLREFAQAGLITSEVMINSLRGSMAEINDMAGKMDKTFTQKFVAGLDEIKIAFSNLLNDSGLLKAFGNAVQATFSAIARSISYLTKVTTTFTGILTKTIHNLKVLSGLSTAIPGAGGGNQNYNEFLDSLEKFQSTGKIEGSEATIKRLLERVSGRGNDLKIILDNYKVQSVIDFFEKMNPNALNQAFERMPQVLIQKLTREIRLKAVEADLSLGLGRGGEGSGDITGNVTPDFWKDFADSVFGKVQLEKLTKAFEKFTQGQITYLDYLKQANEYRYFNDNKNDVNQNRELRTQIAGLSSGLNFDQFGPLSQNFTQLREMQNELEKNEARKVALLTGDLRKIREAMKREVQLDYLVEAKNAIASQDSIALNNAQLKRQSELLALNRREFESLAKSPEQFIIQLGRIKRQMDFFSASDWSEAITYSFTLMERQASSSFDRIHGFFNSLSRGFENLFVEAPKNWKQAFSNFTNQIINDIQRVIIKTLILDQITRQISNALLSKIPLGNSQAAAGSLPSLPAGGSSGVTQKKLAPVINITNNTDSQVSVTEGTGDIELMIEKKVAGGIVRGDYDASFRQAFGVTRKGY